MIANVHIFNVRHGDSIAIELIDGEIVKWIVIDSNRVKRDGIDIVPVVAFLTSKNVKEIDTVILTHFHADHYTGFDEILSGFKINKFLIPPVFSEQPVSFNKQIRQIAAKTKDLIDRSSDEEIGKRAFGLAYILKFIAENESKIIMVVGPENALRIEGIDSQLGRIFLPLKRIKGIRHAIEQGTFELDTFKEMNDASVVISLEFGTHRLLFGADSTLSQWEEHQRQMKRGGVTGLSMNGIKVPHHGSNHNNTEFLYQYLLGTTTGQRAYISANGKSHPDDEFFGLVEKFGLKPYCTNLAKQCMGSNVTSIAGISRIPSEFRSFVTAYDIEDLPVGCQGDITIHLDGTSETVYSSLGNVCPFRFAEPTAVRKLI